LWPPTTKTIDWFWSQFSSVFTVDDAALTYLFWVQALNYPDYVLWYLWRTISGDIIIMMRSLTWVMNLVRLHYLCSWHSLLYYTLYSVLVFCTILSFLLYVIHRSISFWHYSSSYEICRTSNFSGQVALLCSACVIAIKLIVPAGRKLLCVLYLRKVTEKKCCQLQTSFSNQHIYIVKCYQTYSNQMQKWAEGYNVI